MIVDAAVLGDSLKAHFIKARPGDPCFRCGKPLEAKFIIWQGLGGDPETDPPQIALHPTCSKHLGANLIADGSIALNEPSVLA